MGEKGRADQVSVIGLLRPLRMFVGCPPILPKS